MSEFYFEEEEFTSEYDTKTVLRILSLTKPYWLWVIGFLFSIAMVSALDSFFTYLSARIIDDGIVDDACT
jgi:ATP-binding cassette subfamily B protein